ncbi:hypothetical protein [Rummeliibacillus pycnus]|uniref:hypothetical protein n=1 Tax=Rummeliibacillus pycnus TaxID=101070 RepID=UPI0037CBF84E
MQLLKNRKLALVSLFLIITAILIGGCKVDFEIKDTDPKEEELLNSRAMKDDKSVKFLSLNPNEKNYLTFTSGTKGYKMLFHKDAIVQNFTYELKDDKYEFVEVTFKIKPDNLELYQKNKYFNNYIGEDANYLVDDMKEKLNGANVKHYVKKDNEYYTARLLNKVDGVPFNEFFAIIHSKKFKTRSVSFYGYASCADVKKTCNAEDKRVEKHFNKIIESFEF